MYGGNDKRLDEIASEVKRTVIGQDNAVDWLCTFADAACARSRIVHERGVDSLSLPNIGSALIVGPTASGKSHLLKTFAKASGLLFQSIDATSITAAGYIGDSFGKQWVRASAALEENPDRNILVFIDEIDKMFAQAQTREGSAIFDLLKPLEGGILEGKDDSRDGNPYLLDCDRCVFVMAGAFTGIEDIIASRLGISRSTIGFGSASQNAPSEQELSEDGLRSRVSLEDIEAWGMPREMAGRLSTVRFLAALDENALRAIIRRNKHDEYARMLPENTRFEIDANAEALLVENALEAHYGARSINQQINEVFFGDLWRAMADVHPIASVTLTARNDKLDFDIVQGDPGITVAPASQRSEQERLSANAAYGLLSRTHNYLMAHGETPSFDTSLSLGRNNIEYAAALLAHSSTIEVDRDTLNCANDYELAEIVLLNALLSLLHDWFPPEDGTPQGLKTLLSMATFEGRAKNPLDILFYQIESGAVYKPDIDGSGEKTESWSWQPSKFVRNTDGMRPADTGGIEPSQDTALGYYAEFKGFPEQAQKRAVRSLAFRLL
ncbi:MAG: AAA family ATPase [Slackia sp.]|nr:AAA family ATPase [Slackia sp.]